MLLRKAIPVSCENYTKEPVHRIHFQHVKMCGTYINQWTLKGYGTLYIYRKTAVLSHVTQFSLVIHYPSYVLPPTIPFPCFLVRSVTYFPAPPHPICPSRARQYFLQHWWGYGNSQNHSTVDHDRCHACKTEDDRFSIIMIAVHGCVMGEWGKVFAVRARYFVFNG
jgi:hypothetical protein